MAFYSIQALLTASANVSKLFWGSGTNPAIIAERKVLRDTLGISNSSVIFSRKMRNNYEHFDERLDTWWIAVGNKNRGFIDCCFGVSNGFGVAGESLEEKNYLRSYDPKTATLFFWGEQINTPAIAAEAYRIFKLIS